MKFGFPGGPRLEWYDRNPQALSYSYEATGVAPHSATERFSYTVPTGKKAFIESAMVKCLRDTAPTTPGITNVRANARGYSFLKASMISSTVGAGDHLEIGNGAVCQAADSIRGSTSDISTGGTVTYDIRVFAVEFDA